MYIDEFLTPEGEEGEAKRLKGLVHIYTGDGKGKTTSAIGLGIRAYGRGFRILMVQFLKGAETGEAETLKLLGPRFVLHRGKEVVKFTWTMTEDELLQTRIGQQENFEFALEEMQKGAWDMVILDEVMGAVSSGMVDLQQVVRLVEQKPENLELVMTGRNAPWELMELADYVSDIRAVKHPMSRGIPARIGIES